LMILLHLLAGCGGYCISGWDDLGHVQPAASWKWAKRPPGIWRPASGETGPSDSHSSSFRPAGGRAGRATRRSPCAERKAVHRAGGGRSYCCRTAERSPAGRRPRRALPGAAPILAAPGVRHSGAGHPVRRRRGPSPTRHSEVTRHSQAVPARLAKPIAVAAGTGLQGAAFVP